MPPTDTRMTVGELWPLALPACTTLAGGEKGLCHVVEWVASLRAAFPLFGGLEKGYLALAHPTLARKLDSRVTPSYLITELHRAQASALVIDEPLLLQDATQADALELPVFVLPAGSDLHEVERDILRALVDQEGQLARREKEARQRLQQLLGHGGIEAVAAELARLAGGEVIVTEPSNIVISRAGAVGSDGEVTEMAFPIRVADRPLGRLIVRAERAHGNPLDTVLARQAAEICGIEMLQRLARQETEERLGAEMVSLLLDRAQEEEAVIARFQRLGYDVTPNRRHVVVVLDRVAEGEQDGSCYDVAHDLRWAMQRRQAGILLVKHHGNLLAFCSFDPSVSDLAIRGWLRDALGAQSPRRCHAGVSRIVSTLKGLRDAVGQALDAWTLGQRITDHESPYYYEELGLYRLLAGLRARDEMKRFYDETLGALADYDAAHASELVHTLQVFFDHNANASQASRALYVHRNTLSYRLQRIVEITGLDLNDAEARLAFQVALKIHRLAG